MGGGLFSNLFGFQHITDFSLGLLRGFAMCHVLITFFGFQCAVNNIFGFLRGFVVCHVRSTL